jgi:hypothetical protein
VDLAWHSAFCNVTVVEPEEDEFAYLDLTRPPITDVGQAGCIRMGDPRTDGLMTMRFPD